MIRFKAEKLRDEFYSNDLRNDLRTVLFALAAFMEGRHNNQDIIITSVFPETGIVRKSKTHTEGRAVDIRTKDWPSDWVKSAEKWVNCNFSTGAGNMQVAVHHSAYGEHFHIQVATRPVTILVDGEKMPI